MTVTEIKDKMHKAIEQIPENISETELQDALALLENLKQKNKRLINFSKILSEDDYVLKKLAQ